MSPQRLYTDDASSSDGGSSASSGRTRAAFHPLQMMQGGTGACDEDLPSAPAAVPLDQSNSSAMSISSDHYAAAAPRTSSRHRSSLSSQAFKVHADGAGARRRVSEGSGSSLHPTEHERHLEDLVSSLQKRLDAALRAAEESASRAERHAARATRLEEENSRLKSDLARSSEEGKEHRALARKVVKDNARLMREANDREADAQRLSNLAEKVRTLSSSAEAAGGRRRRSGDSGSAGAVVPEKCDDAVSAGAQLDAVNLSNECESLRRENRRLRAEAEEARRREAAATAAADDNDDATPATAARSDLTEPPSQDRRHSHGRRVSALQKMASIKKMTSILNINDADINSCHRDLSPVGADANKLGVTAAEDFLWDE